MAQPLLLQALINHQLLQLVLALTTYFKNYYDKFKFKKMAINLFKQRFSKCL
jgi:hypothetical protein